MNEPGRDAHTSDDSKDDSTSGQHEQSYKLFVSSQDTPISLGQEQLFRSVWERAADAMVLLDEQGIVLLANPAYFQLYGYSADEIIGQHFAVIFPPAERAKAIEQYSAAFHAAPAQAVHEGEIQRADGTERIVE